MAQRAVPREKLQLLLAVTANTNFRWLQISRNIRWPHYLNHNVTSIYPVNYGGWKQEMPDHHQAIPTTNAEKLAFVR
jgi:hypothetical protein